VREKPAELPSLKLPAPTQQQSKRAGRHRADGGGCITPRRVSCRQPSPPGRHRADGGGCITPRRVSCRQPSPPVRSFLGRSTVLGFKLSSGKAASGPRVGLGYKEGSSWQGDAERHSQHFSASPMLLPGAVARERDASSTGTCISERCRFNATSNTCLYYDDVNVFVPWTPRSGVVPKQLSPLTPLLPIVQDAAAQNPLPLILKCRSIQYTATAACAQHTARVCTSAQQPGTDFPKVLYTVIVSVNGMLGHCQRMFWWTVPC
jgi:hypothetical protein